MVRRTTILRMARSAAAALLALAIGRTAGAQSLTIGGGSSQTSQAGAEFATTVLGDPWDFDQRTDWVHMYSDNETGASAWAGTPTQDNGVFRGVSSGRTPSMSR